MPVIALLGPIASGKTTLANAILERHPDWTHLSIDRVRDADGDWPDLIEQVYATETPLVVESVALLADYRAALTERHALLVCLVCPERVRASRVRVRGDIYRRPKYDDRRTAHVAVDGTRRHSTALVDRLVAAAAKRAG